MERIYDLPCMENRKSFYGKAKVIETSDGEKILLSYNTRVGKITKSGNYEQLWSGRSLTTNRHINSFKIFFGVK